MTTNDCNSTQVAATETARQPAAEPGQHCVCLCRVQALSCYRPLGSDADVRERRGRAPGSRSKRVKQEGARTGCGPVPQGGEAGTSSMRRQPYGKPIAVVSTILFLVSRNSQKLGPSRSAETNCPMAAYSFQSHGPQMRLVPKRSIFYGLSSLEKTEKHRFLEA
jgi:hypothetical protein